MTQLIELRKEIGSDLQNMEVEEEVERIAVVTFVSTA